MDELDFLNDGSYELDAGAYFGIVPKAIWSRYFNDNENKIRITTNVPLLNINNRHILLDAGIGNNFSDKFRKIFKPIKDHDIEETIENDNNIKDIDKIIVSHMHFDHCGHVFSKSNLFRNTSLIVQKKELQAYRHPNEFTRGSYIKDKIMPEIAALNGSTRINGNINVIITGGHSEGHMVTIFNINSHKYMYGGDLFPSAFHIKPYYITAIDSYPVESLRLKKKLVKKAIKENITIIFNHDPEHVLARVYGNSDKPELQFQDIKS
jgi:glyoxylase-like metal-dependent hydrolase (beta-lactamase superfamily II)